MFTLITIFFFFNFILIYININLVRNLNIDDSIFSALFSDGFASGVYKNLLIFFSFLFLLVLLCFLKIQKVHFEYSVIFSFAFAGFFLIISTNDLFLWFLALELQSFAYMLLQAKKQTILLTNGSGLKYFIFGSLASSLYLFGIL